MEQMVSIGDRLREERQRLDMNQTQLGELGGVTKKTQMLYESGERFPDAAYLAAIAEAGADVRYIVTDRRDGPTPVALSADEQVLLDGYRALDGKTKKRLLAFVLGGEPPPTTKDKTVIHGKIGNKMGDNTGKLTVNMGGKKK